MDVDVYVLVDVAVLLPVLVDVELHVKVRQEQEQQGGLNQTTNLDPQEVKIAQLGGDVLSHHLLLCHLK